ncbi:LuxR C-terminal-related transcriptional regulator [Actinokineospora auranticolor]|uniref:DNA-binding NarL/FixJ family response regulator n=1 Tax=Actinokineospora auranticolor TaxID=155976 RepID=A0A2S6GDB7_9PSEU|nr:LuxR C-terminal-related transcriptional regulator [Actinokineospora auranticolor]PPK63180.1 DNA-binding NarL/FixJ family response regulator [Actinokineospora auranticolor]
MRTVDPLLLAGITACLARRPGLVVPPAHRARQADLLVIAVDRLAPDGVAMLARAVVDPGLPVVLVTDRLGAGDARRLVAHRVRVVLPLAATTGDRLADTVLAVEPAADVSAAELVEGFVAALPAPLAPVVEPREREVLRLLADGCTTEEIAISLGYSARTVKNLIHGVASRLGVRNRQHAVAHALRAGLI